MTANAKPILPVEDHPDDVLLTRRALKQGDVPHEAPTVVVAPTAAPAVPIRVLLVEDERDDALLVERALRQGGFVPDATRVDSAAALERALAEGPWDVVITDWEMPGFGGLEALALVQRVAAAQDADVPVILASGKITEAMAVDALRAGAKDFVPKDNLARLAPAVAREVRETEVRRERRAAEQARRELTARLIEGEHIAHIGYWEADVADRRMTWTDEVFRLFERDPALGPPTFEESLAFLDAGDRQAVQAATTRAVEHGVEARLVLRLRVPSGRPRTAELTLLPVRGADGPVTRLRGTLQDVTALSLAQEANQRLVGELGERLRELSAIQRVSRAIERDARPIPDTLALVAQLLPGGLRFPALAQARVRFGDMVAASPDWVPPARAIEAPLRAGGRAGAVEVAYRELPPGGDPAFLPEEQGLVATVAEVLAIHLERREAQAGLEARERFLADIVDTVPDVLYKATYPGFATSFVSPAIEHLLGYPAEAFTADPGLWGRLVLEEDRARVSAELPAALAAGGRCRAEYRMRHRDGSTVAWIQDSLILARDAAGQPAEVVGCMTDITSLKRAQGELRDTNRALRALSAVNEAVLRARDEAGLLAGACEALGEAGGYALVWVGLREHDEAHTLRVGAAAGRRTDVLKDQHFTWDDRDLGLGPSGQAVRSGQPQVYRVLPPEAAGERWYELLRAHEARAIAAYPLVVEREVVGSLAVIDDQTDFPPDEAALLGKLAANLAFGLRAMRLRAERDAAVAEREQHLVRLHQGMTDVVKAIVTTMEVRDPYTAGHQQRVAELAVAIARETGMDEEHARGLHLAAMVHDIGKIQVPQEILARPGRLSEIEFAFIKVHPQVGYDILKGIDFPWPIAEMVYQHHERLDGQGYPRGLAGEAILPEARIIAVADVVEAMASDRPYRAGLGIEAALAEIRAGRGTRYDPTAVDACLALFERGWRMA